MTRLTTHIGVSAFKNTPVFWYNLCEIEGRYWVYEVRGQSIKKPNFFYLLLYLQLNQTCLLQSTPLHSWYTAPNVFSSSETRPGTCFAGWREGPLSNFLLSPLSSEIGDLLVRILTSGTRKSSQGPNLEIRAAWGGNSHPMLRLKFTDEEWRVSRCIVMVQHPGVICPRLRPLPSHCLPQTLQDI